MSKRTGCFARKSELGQWVNENIFTKDPNIPKLVGDMIGLIGVLFLLLSLKSTWYGIPEYFFQNELGECKTALLKSPWEKKFKFLLLGALPIFGLCFFFLRCNVFARTMVQGNFATAILALAFGFAELTIVDSEIGHLAAIHVSHHDNLAWYGGDIATSRGQEPYGNAVDYIAKDLPMVVSAIPLPYSAQSFSSFQDYIQWSGMCPSFWYYLKKGWGLLILAGIFILISALCVRLESDKQGLASDVVSWVIKRSGVVLLIWFSLTFTRTQLCAHYINQSRHYYENRQLEQSRSALVKAGKVMPSVKWDSSVVLQTGALDNELGIDSPVARLHEGFALEIEGRHQAALLAYKGVAMQEYDKPAKLEAYRAIMRSAIVDFNSDIYIRCESSLSFVESRYPTLIKTIFLRFILAVKKRDFNEARDWQRKLYAASSVQQMPDKRGYLASTHQYLAKLAFDRQDYKEAWQQNIYRVELNKKGAQRDTSAE